MTPQQYIIERKLNILDLGQKLGNISEACRRLGVSRQHFYDIQADIRERGIEGLLENSRKKAKVGNRIAKEIEEKVLEYSLQWPTHGQVRVANELIKEGFQISAGGVRCVWIRNGLENKSQRLKRLEKHSAENGGPLTESQVQALELAREEKETLGEIETHHPGFLLGQDTYFVGTIKGVGRIYQQTAIDTYSNVGFAKLYLAQNALSAADFLNDKVLPFFDEHNCQVLRILTDRGTEYGHKSLEHPYQLFLELNSIEHSRTKARSPQTNGATERLNRTIDEEFYQVAFRKRLYSSLEQIQSDLDQFMHYYNYSRTNQGKFTNGRTPIDCFINSLELNKIYPPCNLTHYDSIEKLEISSCQF
jgi:transposase InsO family protein